MIKKAITLGSIATIFLSSQLMVESHGDYDYKTQKVDRVKLYLYKNEELDEFKEDKEITYRNILINEVNNAKKIIVSDYTKTSIDKLENTIISAEKMLDDTYVSEGKLIRMTNDIKKAVDNLIRVDLIEFKDNKDIYVKLLVKVDNNRVAI